MLETNLFGAYLFYNIGYKAKAKILSVIDWATGDRMAYNPDKMLQLYEKKGTIPMSHSNAEKRDSSIHTDRIPQIDADLLDNTTHSVLNPAADIFRRTDISGSGDPKTPEFSNNGKCPPGATGFRVPELRFNCAFLSTYQVVNEIKDADGDVSERLTEDVPGLCDDIVKLNPLQSRFTFSQGEKYTKPRYKSVCPDGTCRQATRDLNAAVRRSNLQLQCDEFPWKSSEQGGTWLPASQRRAKCVPSFQNNWHGQCLGMMGSLTSNWKQLNSTLREDSDVPDLWVPWQDKTKWVTAGDYGKNGDYKQKLVLYESAMPPQMALIRETMTNFPGPTNETTTYPGFSHNHHSQQETGGVRVRPNLTSPTTRDLLTWTRFSVPSTTSIKTKPSSCQGRSSSLMELHQINPRRSTTPIVCEPMREVCSRRPGTCASTWGSVLLNSRTLRAAARVHRKETWANGKDGKSKALNGWRMLMMKNGYDPSGQWDGEVLDTILITVIGKRS